MTRVGLVGAPNAGKTTLFNRLSGMRAKVGNYPGMTVEQKTAILDGGLELIDLPGAYSLAPRSEDEAITLRALVDDGRIDVAVCVVDASQLPRALYPAMQLKELGQPFVVALTMLDLCKAGRLDIKTLEYKLGVPVVDARDRGAVLGALGHARSHTLGTPGLSALDDEALSALKKRGAALAHELKLEAVPDANLGLWAAHAKLSGVALDDEGPIDNATAAAVVTARMARAASVLKAAVKTSSAEDVTTARLDRLALNPVIGPVLFFAVFFALFTALSILAEPLMGLIEDATTAVSTFTASVLPTSMPLLRSLVLDGVIAGVGNVVVFVPQIAILFLFLGVLEDSGYLARAAFLLDRVMSKAGFSGRAFVPLLSGFACAVPAIMATRTLSSPKDRLLTILVTPLMSCSARLPVYALMIATVFAGSAPVFGFLPTAALLMTSMYLLSIVAAFCCAFVFKKILVKSSTTPLILELPPYRAPRIGNVAREVWVRTRIFLVEAGTIILALTVVLWALFTFPRADVPPSTDAEKAAQIEHSIAGRMGKAIEPVVEPLGFDWKIGVGLIASFAAREVLVSSLGLTYGLGDVDEESKTLRQALQHERRPDGSPRFTPLVGLSLMVFFVLAMQCMSTLAAVKRETRSWRWPIFQFTYMTALAYGASLIVYQGGRLLGFT